MRKVIVAIATTAGLGMACVVPTGALANAGTPNRTPESGFGVVGWIGTSQGGAHRTTTQYRASYNDFRWGPVTCSGVNQTGKNISSPYGRDSFTCTSTIGDLTTRGGVPVVGYSSDWFSDFWALQDQFVPGTYTITATDGLTYYTAVANY